MAISRVQGGAKAHNNTTSLDFEWASPTTTGGLLIVAVVVNEVDGDVTTTAPAGWTALTSVNLTGLVRIDPFYIPNAASRSGIEVFTISAARNAVIGRAEYSGIAAAPLDREASATGSSTTADSGTTAATTQAKELWFAIVGLARRDANAQTPSSGWTRFLQWSDLGTGSNKPKLALFERVVSATDAANMTVPLSVSMDWAGKVVTFKAGVSTYSAQADIDLFFDIESYASRSRRPERRSDYVRPHGPADRPPRLSAVRS